MAMYTAYFDYSGSENTVVMAGYVAPVIQWTKFKEDWNFVLDDSFYGLPENTIFHMREFAHSVGAFGGLKGDEPKRKHFIERLMASQR